MAISDNYAPDVSPGNGVTTVFTGNWSPQADEYMRVYLRLISTGELSAALDQGAGADEYTLSFSSSGYSITLGTAPSSLYEVVRAREVALTQTAPFTTAKGYQGGLLERTLDKIVAICQDTQDLVGRQLRVPLGDSATSLEYPVAELRALKYAAFDADGNPIATEGTDSATPISAAMAPVVAATTLTAARSELDVLSSAQVTALIGATPIRILRHQIKIANGTYTPHPNLIVAGVKVWGGGGGGGGVNGTSAAVAGGGGGGGYSEGFFTAAQIGVSQAVNIGTGGTAGANTGGTGGTGGTTSLGSLIQATGGAGGVGNTSGTTTVLGGAGGLGSLGTDNRTGSYGSSSTSTNSSGTALGGAGGEAPGMGGAGRSSSNAEAVGADATANSGGGGGGAKSAGNAFAGGTGGSGYMVITEYCSA